MYLSGLNFNLEFTFRGKREKQFIISQKKTNYPNYKTLVCIEYILIWMAIKVLYTIILNKRSKIQSSAIPKIDQYLGLIIKAIIKRVRYKLKFFTIRPTIIGLCIT